jgi:hypothetical protein
VYHDVVVESPWGGGVRVEAADREGGRSCNQVRSLSSLAAGGRGGGLGEMGADGPAAWEAPCRGAARCVSCNAQANAG